MITYKKGICAEFGPVNVFQFKGDSLRPIFYIRIKVIIMINQTHQYVEYKKNLNPRLNNTPSCDEKMKLVFFKAFMTKTFFVAQQSSMKNQPLVLTEILQESGNKWAKL